jgi:hypothetical protein
MKRLLFNLIISSFLLLSISSRCYSEGIYTDTINDGPYIFNVKHKLIIKWIDNNVLTEDFVTPENYPGIKNKFNLLCNYNDLADSYLLKTDYSQSFNSIDSIAVISDVHGKYYTYINLLKANGIIDKNLNWKFGRGHLVVLGDLFDRGDMVTEVLWHLFGLEKQAEETGGKVHILLGNHELLVLGKSLNYINEKYEKVEKISNTRYYNLYSRNSVLGNWLRNKPVMVLINNILFVHGGISIELIHRNLTIKEINQIFSNHIVGRELKDGEETEEQMFLAQSEGPVWYRGYFNDKNFNEKRLDSILDFYGTQHIVVGHTTHRDIQSKFNNKILGVDAGIGAEQPGGMLIYKNGIFYKGYITGNRIKL